MEVLGHSDEAVERVGPVGEPNQVQAHRRLVLLKLDQLQNIALDWGLEDKLESVLNHINFRERWEDIIRLLSELTPTLIGSSSRTQLAHCPGPALGAPNTVSGRSSDRNA